MNEIIKSVWSARDIKDIWIRNPLIAEKFKAGQFLIIHQDEKSERIPLTIVDVKDGQVRLIVQKVGYSTSRLCSLEEGKVIKDVVGPLGKPSEVETYGKAVCLAGGIGSAPLMPVAKELKAANNHVTIIEGVRCKDYLILDDELEEIADEFILTSDDGSIGRKGLVTSPLREMIKEEKKPDFVYAAGPPVMMHAVSKITKKHNIPLTVSLNPIMVDGTGMCGSCRVELDDQTKFACVDGPEFDGNKVNFELFIKRLMMYDKEERMLTEEDHRSYLEENGG